MNTGLSGMNSNQFPLRPVPKCPDSPYLHGSELLQLVVTRDRVLKARKQRFLTTVDKPRAVRVMRPNAGLGVQRRAFADTTNPWHVTAPMTGDIVNVAVGLRVSAGSTPLGLEAMKMETRDGGPGCRG